MNLGETSSSDIQEATKREDNLQDEPVNDAHAVLPDEDIRAYVVEHLEEAIQKGWIRAYYQPVIRTLTGKLCGFEALARWIDPVYGPLVPAVFIPALEEAKLVHLLDAEIVRQVCQNYREYANEGGTAVPVSFNLSRLDFDLCDIFEVVEKAARMYGVPRRMLNIEITETVFGSDPAFMTGAANVFRNAGYQVWMDDFGSGYSSLNALKDFEIDELKIDMEFLNRFGEKSKVILASVVDMAKKLGIQTLAEGVETEEHRTYLRRIGCEKMQGYLFGRPLPFGSPEQRELRARIGTETTSERLYVREIGSVNTLSLSERDFTADNSTQDYVTSMPLAIVEYADGEFKVLDSNRVFREGLVNVGIASVEEAEQRVNDLHLPTARQARLLVETIERDKYIRMDYVAGGVPCAMRVKHISSQNGKVALLVSIDDAIEQNERKRHDRMDDVLDVMYTIYEHVDVIHLDEGYIEPVFGNIGLHTQFDAPEFGDVTQLFAESQVYARDQRRYVEFMDHSTMIERIDESGENFISGFFRLRDHGGEYSWKMFGLFRILDQPGNQVMLCIRSTHWDHDGLLQAAFDENFGMPSHDLKDADLTMTDGSLWRAIVRSRKMNLFWKDNDRRFVGANKAFLDYYGFDSVADIVGKTDEDMGWHIDPAPFKEDELRVLNEGTWIRDASGHCIVDGEVRTIVANKCPVYRNGRIVGLVGYFVDVNDQERVDRELSQLPTRDKVTGVLNFTGLEAATWQFVDAYRRQGIDFCMMSVNLENLSTINNEFGYEFGDKVLRRVAHEMVDIVGHRRVVGHVYADRFVVLTQQDSDEEVQSICDEIERRLMAIAEIDGVSCTVFAFADFSRFSNHGDIDAMKKFNRDRRRERRERWLGSAGADDVITTSLI